MRVVNATLVNDSLQLQALRLMGLLRSLKSYWQGWTPCLKIHKQLVTSSSRDACRCLMATLRHWRT